jgi:hypothetical protein
MTGIGARRDRITPRPKRRFLMREKKREKREKTARASFISPGLYII